MRNTIAVIGAGCSGILTAFHLLNEAHEPLDLLLVDPNPCIGRGKAYGATHPLQVLNARAKSMGAISGRPEDFVEWASEVNEVVGPDDFASRALYGTYLESLLQRSNAHRLSGVELIVSEATALVPRSAERRSRLLVGLRGGSHIEAESVVLATGPISRPMDWQCDTRGLLSPQLFVSDPWRRGSLDHIGPNSSVLLIGTGLTMVDVAVELADKGVDRIVARSRRGLLPAAHQLDDITPSDDGSFEFPVASARELVRVVRQAIDKNSVAGGDWRAVMKTLRENADRLWSQLPEVEQERLFRLAFRYWEIHRHLMAPQVAARVAGLQADGRLDVGRGRLLASTPSDNGVRYVVGIGNRREEGLVDAVINCTGPSNDYRTGGRLGAQLISSGLGRPGRLGNGLAVDENGAVVTRAGEPADGVYAIGWPRFWLDNRDDERSRDLEAGRGTREAHGGLEMSPLTFGDGVQVITFEADGLGDRSYLVHDGDVAIVIDPQRDLHVYVDAAKADRVKIEWVLETHIHNDYVSGGFALAHATGACYGTAAGEPVEFEAERLGATGLSSFSIGSLVVEVIDTPGHTAHHLSYLVSGRGVSSLVFTGGSLLGATTGRTDLLGVERTEELAAAQWRSVRRLLDDLDPNTAVFPTHGFGSFCAASVVATDGSLLTIEQARIVNVANRVPVEEFVLSCLEDPLPIPAYYSRMAPLNRTKMKPPRFDTIERVCEAELVQRLEGGATLIDLRTRRSFAAEHRLCALNFELNPSLSTYVGWLIDFEQPLVLACAPEDVDAARQLLARIARDQLVIASCEPLPSRDEHHRRTSSYPVRDFDELRRRLEAGDPPHLIDVRFDYEWKAEHLAAAEHISLPDILSASSDLSADQELWLHCGAGYRASIAASILSGVGLLPVLIDDSFERAPRDRSVVLVSEVELSSPVVNG